MRVAGNIARNRAQEAAKRREGVAPAAFPRYSKDPELLKQRVGQVAVRGQELRKGIGRGSRQFGQSFFRPFAHASSVLWLEITGCFFALFAAFFAQNLYKLRLQYAHGPAHSTFLLYCFLTILFVYFSTSSFLRARIRSRKQAAGR